MNSISDKTTSRKEIRPMTEKDFEEAVLLVVEFYKDSLSEYGTVLSEDKLLETFAKAWRTSFVLESEGKLVGLLAGHVTGDICSSLPVYEELFWYVLEPYRKYGIKLFRYVQQWCRIHGIHRMTACCMWNSKTDKLFKVYQRLGFQPMETRFIMILD